MTSRPKREVIHFSSGIGIYFPYMTERIKPFLPAIILGLILIVLLGWYMISVPAPVKAPTTTNTPAATEPVTLDEDATYYTVKATYPTTTTLSGSASAQADQAAVLTMKTFVEQEIARFKDNGNFANLTHDDIQMQGLDQRKYALGIEYTTHESKSTLSYVYQMYADTGGAHPNTYYRTFTFDKTSGAVLELGDVFLPNAKYLQTLSEKSRSMLPPMIAKMVNLEVSAVDTDYIKSGTLPEADAFQSFYFEGNNLVLLFPPYQIGPYVLGMILLPIPTSELKDLRPEYTK